MGSEILLEPLTEEVAADAPSAGTAALQQSEEALLTLRFAISASDSASLDALRHARRSMLREEWTLGRNSDGPSLEAAVFSATEITWTVPLSWREACIERLSELRIRANRALAELRRS
jgi:hypothetical protein